MKSVIDQFSEQAELFERFSQQSFTWQYVERPALVNKMWQLSNIKGQVLDVGCGTGRILQFLAEAGIPKDTLGGLDASPSMLHIASQKTRLPYLMPFDIARPLSLSSSSYRLITAIHVFQHLDPLELSLALKNVYRLLAPGGSLIYIVGHPKRDLLPLDSEKYKQPKAWRERRTPWDTFILHFYRSTPAEYTEATIKAGFLIEEEQVLRPIDVGLCFPDQYLSHTKLPSRLLVQAIKPQGGF